MDDCLIIGGGVAGYSAGLYARRYGLTTRLFIGPDPGGATATAARIDNYPGVKSIDGFDLAQTIASQAKSAGAIVVDQTITHVSCTSESYIVTDDTSKNYQAKTIIFANGTSRRHLGLEREKELTGKGVSYCATCDGPLFKGKTVAIVGGGDSAVKGALVVAAQAEKVYLISREKQLHGEPINLKALMQFKNIELIPENEIVELIGSDHLIGVRLENPIKADAILNLDGLFVEVGADPDTTLAKSLQVKTDSTGHIDVDKTMHTNIPGIFAAGDITNGAGDFWQDIVAAAQGATAATSVFHYLNAQNAGGNMDHCVKHAKISLPTHSHQEH